MKMKFRLADTGGAGPGELNAASITAWVIGILGALFALVIYFLNRLRRIKTRPWVAIVSLSGALLIALLLVYFDQGKSNSDPPTYVVETMRNCAVDFSGDKSAPSVNLEFHQEKEGLQISYTVMYLGSVAQEGTFRVTTEQMDDAGKLLAYRLFGIKKKTIGEEPAPEPEKKEKKEDKQPATTHN
jgi:hypothetical protein